MKAAELAGPGGLLAQRAKLEGQLRTVQNAATALEAEAQQPPAQPATQEPGAQPGPGSPSPDMVASAARAAGIDLEVLEQLADDGGAGGDGVSAKPVRLEDLKRLLAQWKETGKRPKEWAEPHSYLLDHYRGLQRRGKRYEHPDGVFGLIREAKTPEAARQVCIDAAREFTGASSKTMRRWRKAAEFRCQTIERERAELSRTAPRIVAP